MKKPQEEHVSVWQLTESDDWDGTARIGMYHCEYLYVDIVLRYDLQGGWWEGDMIPYLVFHNRVEPVLGPLLEQWVDESLENETLRYAVPVLTKREQRGEEKVPYVDVLVSGEDLVEVAQAGMTNGWTFSEVTFVLGNDDPVCLRFYNDEDDLPPEDVGAF